jgi:hypothetical protein
MEHYVGLDVSLKQTSICVVNQAGSVVREGVVDSDPDAMRTHQNVQFQTETTTAAGGAAFEPARPFALAKFGEPLGILVTRLGPRHMQQQRLHRSVKALLPKTDSRPVGDHKR